MSIRPLTAALVTALIALPLAWSHGDTQEHADDTGVSIQEIADGFYLLGLDVPGSSTIMLSLGDDGPLLVDSHYSFNHEAFAGAIRQLTSENVRYIINTHWHPDHVGANEHLHAAGAQIFAHDSVRLRLGEGGTIEFFGAVVEPHEGGGLPQITFDSELSLHLNGQSIRAFFTAPAHTDGDIVVFFPEANIVHMGDIYIKIGFPFLDASSGAGVDGNVAAYDRVLAMIDDDTIVIPGHGPLATRQDLQDYRDMFVAVRDAVHDAVHAGMTLEETLANRPTAAYDDRYGVAPFTGDAFVTMLHGLMAQEHAGH